MIEQRCICGNVGRISYGDDYRPIRECSCGGTVTHGELVSMRINIGAGKVLCGMEYEEARNSTSTPHRSKESLLKYR